MARFRRRRGRSRYSRRRSGGGTIMYVGKKRSKFFGLSVPTLLVVGGVVFLLRKHITPFVDKVKAMISK